MIETQTGHKVINLVRWNASVFLSQSQMAVAFLVLLALAAVSAQQKVALDFYGEAFCPYCQDFVRTGVCFFFLKLLFSIARAQ